MNNKTLTKDIEKHLLNDEKPSIYLEELKEKGKLDVYPFSYLKKLEEVNQSPKYHPEGNVWKHTMMVIDEGAKYNPHDKKAVMWALLLHDIGKIKTTRLKNGRLVSYDHDKTGEIEGKKFLKSIMDDEEFIKKTTKLIRYHMHLLYIVNNMPFADIEGMKKYNDIHDLAIVFLSDRIGRGGINEEEMEKIKNQVEDFKKNYK